jgi:hypothetical protein
MLDIKIDKLDIHWERHITEIQKSPTLVRHQRPGPIHHVLGLFHMNLPEQNKNLVKFTIHHHVMLP